jgi:hypothetical protein
VPNVRKKPFAFYCHEFQKKNSLQAFWRESACAEMRAPEKEKSNSIIWL